MLPTKLAFLDIETTGLRSSYDRIIEIGILRVEENALIKTFHSLINPETYLPKEIVNITGITTQDLENAPTFRGIKNEILETINDCVLVAHNARFDYGFIKTELKRENISFGIKHLCTVRLSRLLFPQHPRHNLDALIERFGIICEQRHRALDDARVLFHFYQKLQEQFPSEILEQAVATCFKKPSLPINLPAASLDQLPESPGVYIFYGTDERSEESACERSETGVDRKQNANNNNTSATQQIPLYVGKSINIRNRVLSHFSADIRSSTEMNIAQQITSIETKITAGELGALFLESQLIKDLLPLYNKKSRIKRELVVIKSGLNKEGYQECFLEAVTTIHPDDLSHVLGFFKSRKQAKAFLAFIAKEYVLCEKLLGLEKTKGACFAYRLGRCNGACMGVEKSLAYNTRYITAFSETKVQPWPFTGAIVIEETEVNGKKEYFIIDNWYYLGKITVDSEGNKKSEIGQERFDLDLYKILRQYLKKNHLRKYIKQIS